MKCISAESKTAKHGQKNISSIPKACTLRTVQGCAYADMETVRFPCCQQTLKQKTELQLLMVITGHCVKLVVGTAKLQDKRKTTGMERNRSQAATLK